jgi:hypothetical protein
MASGMAYTPECKTVIQQLFNDSETGSFCVFLEVDKEYTIIVKKHNISGTEEKAINQLSFPDMVEFTKTNYATKPAYIIFYELEVKQTYYYEDKQSTLHLILW